MTESVLLSVVGGVLGVVLSLWLTDVMARAAAESIPRGAEISVDVRALLFALGVSALCGTIFGLAPAWQLARSDVNAALKRQGRGVGAVGRARTLALFAAAEVALAFILLASAGLLLVSFEHLRHVDAGFEPSNVVTAPAYLPEWKYSTPEKQRAFFSQAVDALPPFLVSPLRQPSTFFRSPETTRLGRLPSKDSRRRRRASAKVRIDARSPRRTSPRSAFECSKDVPSLPVTTREPSRWRSSAARSPSTTGRVQAPSASGCSSAVRRRHACPG
jgi:hypothetical protein